MSCQGVFVKFPNRDLQICIPIYKIIVQWHDPNPPDPPFHDLRILATINEGIAHISDQRIRESLAQAVHDAAKAVSLPEGVTLGDGLFKVQHETMAA